MLEKHIQKIQHNLMELCISIFSENNRLPVYSYYLSI